jgi:RNA polymerase sigma-70 factor (ECF subfamily)
LEQLLPIYWRPLYVYARRQGLAANHAEDAVQGFFLHLLEWVDPAPLDPAKASLRRYLKAAFDHYLVDVHQKDSLEGRHVAPLDTGPVERELSAAAQASEAAYDREWALALMERALGRLEQEEQHARRSEQTGIVLDYFRTDAVPDYAATAAACHMSVLQLKASLHRVRARFRELLTEEVADTLEEGDVEAEIGELLAVLARKVQLCQRCGAPLPSERLAACPLCVLSADIAAATLGDSLELREEIGRGGMGCVFKAHHRRLGRAVAVKLIAAPVAAQPGSRRLFEREAQALAKLDHPKRRRGTRLRRAGRPVLHRHGVRRRTPALGNAAAGRGGRHRHRAPGARRTGSRPWAGHRAPRHQARQHPARRSRAGEGGRLRHRPSAR